MDSFHCHLNELEGVVQNIERMKQLLEEDGVLSLAAFIGSTPVVGTLIQKGVGKEKIYYSSGATLGLALASFPGLPRIFFFFGLRSV